MTIDPRPRWTCSGCGQRERSARTDEDGEPLPPAHWRWISGALFCRACAFSTGADARTRPKGTS